MRKRRSVWRRGSALPEPLRQQFHVLYGTSVGLFATCSAIIIFRIYYGRFFEPDWFIQNVIIVASALVSWIAPGAVVDQRSPNRATLALTACVLGNCIAIAVVRGGFWGLPMVWLTIISLIVTALMGVRWGIFTAVIVGIVEIGFYVVEVQYNSVFEYALSDGSYLAGRYLSAVTALIFVTFFTWIFGWTFRRSLYEQGMLRARTDAMRKQQKVKSEFVAMMSHELRTPLNAVIGFSRIIYRATEGKMPEDARDDFEEVRQLGEQLLERIDDILDIERLESGMLTRSDYALDLSEAFRGVAEHVAYDQVYLQITCNLKNPKIVSDPDRLQRLLVHFVNQAKSTTNTVRLHAVEVEDAVVVSVDGRATGTAPHRFRAASAEERGDREFSLYMAHLLARFVGAHLILEDNVSKLVLFREPKR